MIRLILACLLSLSFTANAAIDTYEFPDDETRKRFQLLSAELRCPKCQNQNLADSNAPIANDLRREIYTQLMDGSSNDEIVDFMVVRYGDFVLYKPKVDAKTYLLWYGPFVLLFFGLCIAVLLARKRRKVAGDETDTEVESTEEHLTAAEQQRLNEILQQDKK